MNDDIGAALRHQLGRSLLLVREARMIRVVTEPVFLNGNGKAPCATMNSDQKVRKYRGHHQQSQGARCLQRRSLAREHDQCRTATIPVYGQPKSFARTAGAATGFGIIFGWLSVGAVIVVAKTTELGSKMLKIGTNTTVIMRCRRIQFSMSFQGEAHDLV